MTQGENDGNCEETGRQEGRRPCEESCTGQEGCCPSEEGRCTRQEGRCSCEEGRCSRQEGCRSCEEGRCSRQEGCCSCEEGCCSCEEGRCSCEEGCCSCEEGCCSCEEGRCPCEEGRCQKTRQGLCPCGTNHTEPESRLAFPYRNEALSARLRTKLKPGASRPRAFLFTKPPATTRTASSAGRAYPSW